MEKKTEEAKAQETFPVDQPEAKDKESTDQQCRRFSSTFSALTLLCGLLVVFNPFSRNPVTSDVVLTIISMSGLFVLLKAFFLAAVQILVYAGAVIVLFLFVIMLLDVKKRNAAGQKFSTFLGFAAVTGWLCRPLTPSNNPAREQRSPAMAGCTAARQVAVYRLPAAL